MEFGSVLSLAPGAAIFYVKKGKDVLSRIHNALVNNGGGKAVSSRNGLSAITISGSAPGQEAGAVHRLVQPLERASINIFGIVTLHSATRVFVSANQAEKALQLIRNVVEVTRV